MRKINMRESAGVCKLTMPKEMSDWMDERIGSGQYSTIIGANKRGYAMKSRNCTVIMVPNWNCDSQFKDIVNKLR